LKVVSVPKSYSVALREILVHSFLNIMLNFNLQEYDKVGSNLPLVPCCNNLKVASVPKSYSAAPREIQCLILFCKNMTKLLN